MDVKHMTITDDGTTIEIQSTKEFTFRQLA